VGRVRYYLYLGRPVRVRFDADDVAETAEVFDASDGEFRNEPVLALDTQFGGDAVEIDAAAFQARVERLRREARGD